MRIPTALTLAATLGSACARTPAPAPPSLSYPAAERSAQVDLVHGVEVADPYRWLEEPDAPATRTWIEAQNALTNGWLAEAGSRDAIAKRLEEVWSFARVSSPIARGERLFFTHNDGLQNQDVWMVADGLDADPRVLLDPNALSADGTVSVAEVTIDPTGTKMAYSLSKGGSDWREWRVRDVDSATDLPDRIEWSKFSTAEWLPDGSGFYYSRYDAPAEGRELEGVNYFQKLSFHRIGTSQGEDRLVYERPDEKEWGFAPTVSDDGRFLVISIWQGTDSRNRVAAQRLDRPDAPVEMLLDGFDAAYDFLGNEGEWLYFRTTNGAPKGRVVAIELGKPDPAAWREIVAEGEATLEAVTMVGDRLVLRWLEDAHAKVTLATLDGQPAGEITLPGLGSVRDLTGTRKDRAAFFSFESFSWPAAVYRYELASGAITPFRHATLPFDPNAFEATQVFVSSKDGTKVPAFVVRKKGVEANGERPTLLYGYGGFDISLSPFFQASNLVWMERGGVYVHAILRGGGEYGEPWHQAGMKLQKQNVFDDFIAIGEWLTGDGGWTRPGRLAIHGRSNGGLLVGAAMTQRPDLFGAAVPGVGVLDMLRFHLFTIGWAWTSDYGSPDDPAEFAALRAYSPYHNLTPGTCYPATLITTADHDDRVVPAHSFKFAAALQHAQGCANPALIRIETSAGHGAGTPVSKRIEEARDVLAFLDRALGSGASS